MNKKLLISLSIVFGVIAVALILTWTLFGLSSVSVERHSTTQNLAVTDEEIVAAGKFHLHASVLFGGKKKAIKNIENFAYEDENFAYIRVLNIETKFPNKFVIHIAEREELFAVEKDGQVFVCDRDLRVLRKVASYSNTNQNAILLSGLEITNEEVKVGDFLSVKQNGIKNFYSGMLKSNRSLAEQIGKFEKITLSSYTDNLTHKEYVSMKLETFAGKVFVINNIDFALAEKIQKMFAVESAIYSTATDGAGNLLDANGEIVYVVKNESNEYVSFDSEKHEEADKVALTYDLIDNCYIKIDNLTLSEYVKRSVADIYYCFVEL